MKYIHLKKSKQIKKSIKSVFFPQKGELWSV